MSRIGNNPVNIPEGVSVNLDGNCINVKGKLGELSQDFNPLISIEIKDNLISFSRSNDQKESRSMHGLYRALVYNMIKGVSVGYTKKLEFIGVGYRAIVSGQTLDFSVGFSHNIAMQIPQEIKVIAETDKGKAPIVTLTSYNKQLLGAVASKIRSFRPPEPYKGKGIRYVDEYVRRKAGKTSAS
jgi:large subunit ribosomal protein L6|tara:strand:+ start:405 stop:956 length:552 start_codon:yes stop_codon:yes gene_type:complete